MGMPLQWHRRQAITLASQLPDSTADALLVIEALRALVETFLAGSPEQEAATLSTNVLPFGSKGAGSSP
jgi:hypothetical protein